MTQSSATHWHNFRHIKAIMRGKPVDQRAETARLIRLGPFWVFDEAVQKEIAKHAAKISEAIP